MEIPNIRGGLCSSIPASFSTLHFPCVTPFGELKKLYLNELRCDLYHRGRYVLLQIVESPRRIARVAQLLSEDELGNTVPVQLYYQGENLHSAVGDVLVSTVCIIVEPWYRMMSNGTYGLRVDPISDVIWLSMSYDKMPRNGEDDSLISPRRQHS